MSKKKHKDPTCPYCQSATELCDSSRVYGKSYGPIWLCLSYPKCDAYVGCHPGTTTPLGRLANAELRQAKMSVHKTFDQIWKRGYMSRGDAYRWLAEQLGLSRSKCHVGMFDVETCKHAVALAKDYLQTADAVKGAV